MGVNRISGQDLAALYTRSTKQAPAPQLRTAEAPQDDAVNTTIILKQNEEQVQRAARSIESQPKPFGGRTRLHIDESSKQVVAQILDENDQVVKQIPPEELLKIADQFRKLQGLLFDQQT